MMERALLLHNMSVPSRTTIDHQGPRSHRRKIVFRLPGGEWSAQAVLARLDGIEWPGTSDEAERELRLRLNQHAAVLPYPAATLIGVRAGDAEYSADFLTVCTVLAKSSTRVYLRDKEPNLANLRSGRAVVLLLARNGEQHD